MLHQYLLKKLNESTLESVLATAAAFLKVTFDQTGDAFKSHLSCVYRKIGVELPSIISNYIFTLLKQVHVYDAVETIIHYLRNNDLEDTAKVIQLFFPYDNVRSIYNISSENDDDDPTDKTLSWEDVIGLQVELATGNQDIDPEELTSLLPSLYGTAAPQDMSQDIDPQDPPSLPLQHLARLILRICFKTQNLRTPLHPSHQHLARLSLRICFKTQNLRTPIHPSYQHIAPLLVSEIS